MSKTTARHALPYAENADVPDIGYWTKQLADAADAVIPRVQAGVTDVPLAAQSWASVPVTFPKPYPPGTVPVVTATAPASVTPYIACVYNITNTGFTLAAGNRDSTSVTLTLSCQWTAVAL